MNFTALDIAEKLDGTIQGNPEAVVNTLAKIEEGKSGDLCFLSNPKYTPFIYTTKASVVIVNKDFKSKKAIIPTLIFVEDAYHSFSQLLEIYNKMKSNKIGIDSNAKIDTTVQIGENVYGGAFTFIAEGVKIGNNVKINPNCYIGENVSIDDNSILFPGINIYHDCKIGKNNILHSGAVIGSDGFGFSNSNGSNYSKIAQIGNVILEDDIEVGANTTIDRATMGSTIIHKGVKLDNQIQIGHNVEIGEHTVIAGQVAIAGSTKIGRNCMIGGSSCFAGHLKIGNNVKVAGHTGVGSNINDNETIQGPYAFNQKKFLKSYIIFKKLPELYKTIIEIKKSLLLDRNK